MILTAHQPVYLPWLGLFHKIALSDMFCSFDDVQYLKRDWNSRNKIKTQNGDIFLTVPVLTTGHREKPIREMEIDNSTDWRRKHWKSIFINYKKTPYFDKYAPFFEDVYKKDWKYLVEINEYMLRWFLITLGITVEYCKASDKHFEGYKSDLVLDMCRKLGANTYVFGTLGKDYAEQDKFAAAGVKIHFQDYKHPVYPQLHGDFIAYMSVLDLLFNCGDKSLDILMSGNAVKRGDNIDEKGN